MGGALDVVRVLLEAGANKNVTFVHEALVIALDGNHQDIVDILDPRRLDLHVAARKGDVDAVRDMVEGTADLEATDASGATALDLALREVGSSHAECAALLEAAMVAAWKGVTESRTAMESYLRSLACQGDAPTKVAALLERKVVNVEAEDKVR